MQNKNGLEICRIALQGIALLSVYINPGPNRSGISDLKIRVVKKNGNGSHSDFVPCKPINIQIKEQQPGSLSPNKSSFDLDRQFSQ